MDIALTNRLPSSLPAPSPARVVRAYAPLTQSASSAITPANDIVVNTRTQKNGTKLVNEQQQDLPDGGYRRSRTYEREDGRSFTKIEEFALTERGARRSVIQQNPSGSITVYEEVLDREDSGNFRRTQRFQDTNGEIATNITTDYQVTDPFVLTGGNAPASFAAYTTLDATRGTQLDLRA